MESFMTLANVDGSGRQVILVKTAGGIIVRAGCFVGSLEEFCAAAARDKKDRYVRVVTACVAAL